MRATPLADFISGILTGCWWLGWLVLLLPLSLLLKETAAALLAEIHALTSSPTPGAMLLSTLHTLRELGWNTLVVSGITSAVSLLIAVPLAALLARTDLRGKRIIILLLLIAAATPIYVTSTGWIQLVSLKTLVADWGMRITTSDPLSASLRQLVASGVIMGIAFAPFSTLFVSVGFLAIPRSAEESALLDTSPWRVGWRVTMPLAAWSMAGSGLLAAVWAAGEMTVVDALWTRTYTEEIFQSFHRHWSVGRAMLMALPLMSAFLLGCLCLAPLVRRWTDAPLDSLYSAGRKFRLGKQRLLISVLIGGILLGLFLFPLADLARLGFSYAGAGQQNSATISPDISIPTVAMNTTTMPLWRRASGWLGIGGTSWVLAVCGALGAVFLATPIAWGLRFSERHSARWWRRLLWGGLLILLATPPTILGMALLGCWNDPAWEKVSPRLPQLMCDTPILIVMLYALRAVPLTVLVLWGSFRQIPTALFDAARLEGAGLFDMLLRIAFPVAKRGFAAAGFVAYALSLSEVGGAIVTQVPGVSLFAIRFATQIHFGVYPDLARLAIIPVLLAIIPAGVCGWLFRGGDGGR